MGENLFEPLAITGFGNVKADHSSAYGIPGLIGSKIAGSLFGRLIFNLDVGFEVPSSSTPTGGALG